MVTISGSEKKGFLDGPVAEALFSEPSAIEVSAEGSIIVGDTGNARIRMISREGHPTLSLFEEVPYHLLV